VAPPGTVVRVPNGDPKMHHCSLTCPLDPPLGRTVRHPPIRPSAHPPKRPLTLELYYSSSTLVWSRDARSRPDVPADRRPVFAGAQEPARRAHGGITPTSAGVWWQGRVRDGHSTWNHTKPWLIWTCACGRMAWWNCLRPAGSDVVSGADGTRFDDHRHRDQYFSPVGR
jgi:hypothetical protein